MLEFPKGFFWGAATSAYQVEGDNFNCDWWEWEKRVGLKDPSGKACRHYEFYKQDFDLARDLGHNVHRLSIEWSRIEPESGKFSSSELSHYRDVIASLKERNIQPIVTLHHFTNPLWFMHCGGWQNKNAPDYFLRYVEKIVDAIGKEVNYWVTINEPMVYVYYGYVLGLWPPQEKSFFKGKQVMDNLVYAHIKAYRLIHNIYKKKNLPSPSVSITLNLQAFVPCTQSLTNKFAAYVRNKIFNLDFIERLTRAKALDFLGVNYYTRSLVEVRQWGFKNLLLDVCEKNHSRLKKNSIGWDIYPQGLYNLLMNLSRYNLRVFILENGICTEDDNLRWDFIREHLKKVHMAMSKGVKVIGYIYWSLIDNFEWDKGFGPRFGLIEVNYNNYQRTVRESAKKFAQVCKTSHLS